MLSEKLTDLQHDFHRSILSTLHVHLDHDNCLEVLWARKSRHRAENRRRADSAPKASNAPRMTLGPNVNWWS